MEFIACNVFMSHIISFYRKSSKGIGRAKVEKSSFCRQQLNSADLKMYEGHPLDALEEAVALIDSRLSLFFGKEKEMNEKGCITGTICWY